MLLFNRETKCLPDTFMTWAGVGGELVIFIMYNIPNNTGGRETHEADRSQWNVILLYMSFYPVIIKFNIPCEVQDQDRWVT